MNQKSVCVPCLKKILLVITQYRKSWLHRTRLEISQYPQITQSRKPKILMPASYQILLRLGVPDNQILLHFGVPHNCSMNISS